MMADILFTRAVIPTNSLRLIHEAVGNLLDPHIRIIRATASTSDLSEKFKPHRNITVYKTGAMKVEARFNQSTSRDNFDIENILDACDEIPIHDLWVHRLVLRFKYGAAPFDFDFKNRPLTPGSEAERWVSTYLKTLKKDGLISRAQLRHLPLMTALSVPRGAHLDGDTLDNSSFVRWLARKTSGLVKLKTVQRVDEFTFRDVRITEPMGVG